MSQKLADGSDNLLQCVNFSQISMTHLDLPNLTAFALEGSGPAALAMSSDQTLTVPASLRGQRLQRGTWGTGKLGAARVAKAWPLHVSTASHRVTCLTLTF